MDYFACDSVLGWYSEPIPCSVKQWRVLPFALKAAVPVGHAILTTSLQSSFCSVAIDLCIPAHEI